MVPRRKSNPKQEGASPSDRSSESGRQKDYSDRRPEQTIDKKAGLLMLAAHRIWNDAALVELYLFTIKGVRSHGLEQS